MRSIWVSFDLPRISNVRSCFPTYLLTTKILEVRRGGKILCIGSLDPENTLYMKIGTRKRLSFIFSYGGQARDLEDVLQMIAKGAICPKVAERPLQELPNVLQELKAGEVEARVALVHR